MLTFSLCIGIFANQLLAAAQTCQEQLLPQAKPHEVGVTPFLTQDLDALLRDAVQQNLTPSAVLLVMRQGEKIYHNAQGDASLQSIFDLASLTKVVATTTSIAFLIDSNKLTFDTSLKKIFPGVYGRDKQDITIKQLLLHTAGFPPMVWPGKLTDDLPIILRRIQKVKLLAAPGTHYRYSDVGFILLGEIVKAVSGQPLDQFAKNHIFHPLGMCSTQFFPKGMNSPQIVAAWPSEGKIGEVYDPLAARMGGIAGHAGLFSTAEDLAILGQLLLNRGNFEKKKFLSKNIVNAMLSPRNLPLESDGVRALGWDMSSTHAGCRGRLSTAAFGHTGYTGTSLWIDPEHQLIVILLTNRTHLKTPPDLTPLRQRIHDVIVTHLIRMPSKPVRTGFDQLTATDRTFFDGKKIGLITNRAAVDKSGRWIGEWLLDQPNFTIQSIFVPEHGLSASLDQKIVDQRLLYKKRTISVFSLFGDQRAPSVDSLNGIDLLLFDIPSVGVRFYTYLNTLGRSLEVAAHHKIPFVILDRPNPLGGEQIDGPVAFSDRQTSTNYHPLPIRFGLTMGELALLYNSEKKLGASIKIVRNSGWQRAMQFDAMNLPWRSPSPNIRSWLQALLYTGIGLLESTNLSVGRGTKTPFQWIGAPWLNSQSLSLAMNQANLAGVYFIPETNTPTATLFRKELCQGIRIIVTDPKKIDPIKIAISIMLWIRKHHVTDWNTDELYRLFHHPPTVQAILNGDSIENIVALWQAGLAQFQRVRTQYLLYE